MADELVRCYERGASLRADGRLAEAQAAYRRGLVLAPRHPALLNNYGLALMDDARYDEAIAVLAHAAATLNDAAPWVNLGNALRCTGRKAEAGLAYRSGLARSASAAAAFNLHAIVYDHDDPAASIAALEVALSCDPSHAAARFHLAALGAGPMEGPDFMLDSERFVAAHGGRCFADTFDTLTHALSLAPPSGLNVELGVRRGTSIRWLARHCGHVHGFDAFQGLPEAWATQPAGLYGTAGHLPEVPDNVSLHVGWFNETLPAFLAAERQPLRFVNVDCDLYSSTRDALEQLAPRIGGGTILVFDEYLMHPGWRDEEHRAFVEAAEQHGWRYEYVAFSLFTKQAVVRVY